MVGVSAWLDGWVAADTVVGTHYYMFPKFSDNNAYFRLNANGAGAPLLAMANPLGHYITNRTGVFIDPYKNGISPGTQTETSEAVINLELYLTAGNVNGTAQASGGIVASASAGALLNATQSLNFYNNLCAYMTAVRGSC